MSTGSIISLASDEALPVLLEDTQDIFSDFWWESDISCWTNDSSLFGKILTNKNLIYLYLNFLVNCKSLILRLPKSIMFNIFWLCAKYWSHRVRLIWVYSLKETFKLFSV